MSISFTSNFLLNARGLTFADGGGLVWSFNKNTNTLTATGGSGGVLSSVGLADTSTSPILTVGGSPLTANGAINITLKTQAAGLVFAGPATGPNAQPTFRAIVATDVPTLNQNTSGTAANITGTVAIANGGSGQITASAAFNALSPLTTKGDILYASAANTAARLAIGSTGNVLTISGGVPVWGSAVTSIAGTAGQITASASTGAVTLSFPANVVIQNAASGVPFTVGTGAAGSGQANFLTAGANFSIIPNASSGANGVVLQSSFSAGGAGPIILQPGGTTALTANVAGTVTFAGAIGVSGNSPPAQSTGWGTPTNGAVVANYNATAATLLQTADVVAQLLTIFKAVGFLGT